MATSTFNWALFEQAIITAGNTAVGLLVPGGAAFLPLLTSLEAAMLPVIQSIGTKQTANGEAMTLFSTTIGVLTILKNKPGLPQEELAKVDNYLMASQNGLAGYLSAQGGFDPTSLEPVTPIA